MIVSDKSSKALTEAWERCQCLSYLVDRKLPYLTLQCALSTLRKGTRMYKPQNLKFRAIFLLFPECRKTLRYASTDAIAKL